MLLKVEKTMSGHRVCKCESMKAPESKGMIREPSGQPASLVVCEFFKIFRTIQHRAGAFNLPSTVEELPFSHLGSCNLRLRELGCSAASKLGIDLGSSGVGGTRNSIKVQIQRQIASSDSETGRLGSGASGGQRGCSLRVLLYRVNLFASNQSEKRTNC